MKTDVTTCIVIDTRRKRNDGTYPVKLRVTYERYSKYYSMKFSLTKTDFNKIMGKAPKGKLKQYKRKLTDEEYRAQDIIHQLPEFSFDLFDQEYLIKKKTTSNVYDLVASKIEQLKLEDRIKTAWGYESLSKSLLKFRPKSKLSIQRITPHFLKEYEIWMIRQGNSVTTVGIYLRNLRAIFNDEIEQGNITRSMYPFGKRKYKIPTGKNIKKALSKAELIKIGDYTPSNEMEAYCRDLWLFSYLANGINLADIAKLQYKNLHDDFLVFIRQKTIRSTSQNPSLIKVYLNERALSIIDRWGNQNKKDFIFPIYHSGMTSIDKIRKVDSLIQSINRYIDRIAKQVGIKKKVTTYTARHSFSTVLKRSGASIEFISESLGHSSILTTRAYLDSFADEDKKKWSEKLL